MIQVAVLLTPGERTPPFDVQRDSESSRFTKLGVTVRMGVTSKGHYAVPLFDGVGKVCYNSGSSKFDGNDRHNKQ